MIKKIVSICFICMFCGIYAHAEDIEVPSILTDPENGPYVWVSADTGIERIDEKLVWRDKSGNGNHMTVYGAPKVKDRAVNQRPAMELTQASTEQCFSVDFPETYVGDSTVFIVANMKQYGEYKGLFSTNTPNKKKVLNTFEAYFLNNQIETGSLNANSSDINKDYLFNKSDGDLFGKYHNFIITEWGNYTDGVWKSTNFRSYYGSYDKASDKTSLKRMVNSTNRNNGLSVGMFNTYVGLSLGARWDFSGTTPESEYAEAIMFTRALSESEILEVSEYLSEKYFKPFPPTDGIEFEIDAERNDGESESNVTVSMNQIEGSVFDSDYYVIAQLYEDKARTMPKGMIVKKSTDELTFTFDKSLYSTIMALSAFGAADENNIGLNIAHPIER
ncbi:MAG: hypothetical protein J6N52_10255 [Clostridia bacterium]|nr:hypothetical protein [Clostridia bacterium]